MSPRIVSKTEYEALKIAAIKLRDNDSVGFLFSDVFNLYISDIVRKIQALELDKTITNGVDSAEYKHKLYDELMAFATTKFQKVKIKKDSYKNENQEYTSQGILELWKQFVFAYIQKCHFLGVVPDKTHLEFLQPQKKNTTLETKPGKFIKRKKKRFL